MPRFFASVALVFIRACFKVMHAHPGGVHTGIPHGLSLIRDLADAVHAHVTRVMLLLLYESMSVQILARRRDVRSII